MILLESLSLLVVIYVAGSYYGFSGHKAIFVLFDGVDLMDIRTNAAIRRLARHLINFPDARTTKILTSIPKDDRIRIIEELERIKNDKKKSS